MYVTLDTSSFNALATQAKRKGATKAKRVFQTNIDSALRKKVLHLVMDDMGGLLGEWSDTASFGVARVLFTIWNDWDAIHFVDADPPIPQPHRKRLRNDLGLSDSGDKLVVRITLQSPEKNIVAEDPDFWDGKNNPKRRGHRNGSVCKYLRDNLGIEVMRLKGLTDYCKGA